MPSCPKIKKHKCSHTDCGKAYSQPGHLTRHMLTHTGVKPYVCETCGTGFSRSDSLATHMRTHSGVKPYACDTCGEAFVQSAHLKQHVIYNHSDRDSREYKEFSGKKNAKMRHRYAMNAGCRAAIHSRKALSRFLKPKGCKKAAHTEELVGCTWVQFIAHLNDNSYGYYVGQPGVHIDHIRPIASFSLFGGPISQREAMNFNNLQLMWGSDNIAKGSSYDAVQYAASDAGKAIAKLRVGWEKQFKTNDATDCNEDSDDDDMGESDYEDEN